MNDKICFSVCMSVYIKDNADYFRAAVESVTTNQTVKPDELVLVCDGSVTDEINEVIVQLQNSLQMPLNLIRLPQNVGHAGARQAALKAAKYDYVAIMDSDDLAESDRFKKQISLLIKHPEVSILGGQINEFIKSIDNVVGRRIVPTEDSAIKEYMKSRCPFNQQTVVMNRSDALKVGGYQDWYCDEDYYLWIRMALNGYKFMNLEDNLVNVRVGNEMYQRRGGTRYFKSEALLQKYMFKNGIISLFRFIYNVAVRFAVQVLMPNKVRSWVFQTFARA